MLIKIIGLGPGDGRYLTQEAVAVLSEIDTLYLRTLKHPAVADLPNHLELQSFDNVYEEEEDFQGVYRRIAREIVDLAGTSAGGAQTICYAVPGHPLIGETTTKLIIEKAAAAGLEVDIIQGLSFIEPTISALRVDALEGIQLFDALEILEFNYPPINGDTPALLGQIYDGLVAADLKLTLMNVYPDEHEVTLVHGAGTLRQQLEVLPLYMIDRSPNLSYLTTLFIPSLKQTVSLNSLAETVAVLRGPNGCAWDQEQTFKSLRNGLLEETSEVLEAIDSEDYESLAEELGDLLYHIVMQCQMASELAEFDLSTIIAGIDAKLKRRHPHVWGDLVIDDSQAALRNWELLKRDEKDQDQSPMDNIPAALPSLARAQLIQVRAGGIGFDWPSLEGVTSKVSEEVNELANAGDSLRREEELGDLLFSLVNLARWLDIDAETSLREANKRFIDRFRLMERIAADRNLDISKLNIDELEILWQESKTITNSAK